MAAFNSYQNNTKICIFLDAGYSRLVYFPAIVVGHRIPAWYTPDGTPYVGRDEASIRAAHNIPADVSLTRTKMYWILGFPRVYGLFGFLGWPEQTRELAAFHPTNVLVTGFDIIFFFGAHDYAHPAFPTRGAL